MLYEFNVYQMEVDEHIFWIAESKSLKGCTGQGETAAKAISELEDNEKVWLDTAKEYNIPIPARNIKKAKTYSGKFSLRMSPYIHEKAAEAADFLGISLNQYINDAIADYNRIITENYNSRIFETHTPYENTKVVYFKPDRNLPLKNIVHKELEEM